jgi:hypothetical protein
LYYFTDFPKVWEQNKKKAVKKNQFSTIPILERYKMSKTHTSRTPPIIVHNAPKEKQALLQ